MPWFFVLFQRMVQVIEERKSTNVGIGEENCQKNRSDQIIPYDRNRVILTPVLTRDHSTYINASFIEVFLMLFLYRDQLVLSCTSL